MLKEVYKNYAPYICNMHKHVKKETKHHKTFIKYVIIHLNSEYWSCKDLKRITNITDWSPKYEWSLVRNSIVEFARAKSIVMVKLLEYL